jgi:regulator of protease activity HflC (stomatin/prohibitin superfamily)
MKNLYAIISLLMFSGCSYIEPGYVGIRVQSYGSQKGVEDFPLITGRVWYNPMTESIYEYPTFMQNSVVDGITFNSSEGAKIFASVGINYSLLSEKVPAMFVKHRQSLDIVTNTYVRTKVQDAFNRVASKFKAVEIVGEKKQVVLDDTKTLLNQMLDGQGFLIDGISFTEAPQGDERVMQSINNVIEATQRAIEAENRIRTVKAEAEQAKEKANGVAQAVLLEARAKADAVLLEAESRAKANKLLAETITNKVLLQRAVEKWDGITPKVFGGQDFSMLIPLEK